MNPWDNPSNYKHTRKKKYTVSVSMPPEGTVVFDSVENTVHKTSSEVQFVITGTLGEQTITDIRSLCRNYTLLDGTPITKDMLTSKVVPGYKNGTKYPCIKPFSVISIPGQEVWAIHIPLNYVFQITNAKGEPVVVNERKKSHGDGDFIICPDAGGYPNLNTKIVVNGEIFADMYDMRAFPNLKSADPNYRSTLSTNSHPEFYDVMWTSIHDMANTAGKLYRANKSREASYEIYKKVASEICLAIHKEYPGIFGKPKAGLNKKTVFIPYAKTGLFSGKRGLEIGFNWDNEDADGQIDVTAYHGDKQSTQTAIGFTFDECDMVYIMREVRSLIMDCYNN